jgi:hypothetical protein
VRKTVIESSPGNTGGTSAEPGDTTRRDRVLALTARGLLLAGCIAVLATALCTRPEKNGIFMDQMTFLLQAISIARDGDLDYTRVDRERFVRLGWGQEPLGLFLRRSGSHYYYAKPAAYAVLVAPFTYLDANRAPLVVNALLWIALLEMTYRWLRRWTNAPAAALMSLACWGLSGALFYVFVAHPDLFIACLLGLCLHWTFGPFAPAGRRAVEAVPAPSLSRRRAVALGLAAGVMVYSRLPLALFAGSFLLFWWMRGHKKAAVMAAAFAAFSLMAFSLVHVLEDGHLTPYQGERVVVEKTDPFSPTPPTEPLPSAQTASFFQATTMSSRIASHVMNLAGYFPKFALHFVAGRRVGMFPYLTPFLVLAVLGLISLGNPKTRPLLWVLVPLALCVLSGFYLTPATYHGGATAIGNRYAVQMTPAFVFCVGWAAIPALNLALALLFVAAAGIYFPGRALLEPATAIRDNFLIFQWNRFRFLPVEPELLWLNCDRVDVSCNIGPITKLFRLSEPLPPQMGSRFWMGKGGYSRFAIMRTNEPGPPIQVRLASPNCRVTGYFISGNQQTPFSVDPNFTLTVTPVLAEPEKVQFRYASLYYWPLDLRISSVQQHWHEPGFPRGTGLFVQFAQPDPLYPPTAPDGSFEFNPADPRASSLLLWGWWDTAAGNDVGRWAGDLIGSAFALPARLMERPYGKVTIRSRCPEGSLNSVFVPGDGSAVNYTLDSTASTQTLTLTTIPKSRFTDHLVRLQHPALQKRTLTPIEAPTMELPVTGCYEHFTFYPPSRIAPPKQ